MALTDTQKLKLEIGLTGDAADLLTAEEIAYFLEKNNNSIRKAALDAAKTVLFMLSQQVHERSGTELEIWGHTWFENYMKTLKLYISDPNYSIALEQAKAYAGGISVSDIAANVSNPDNLVVNVDIGIPMDGEAITSSNTRQNIFKPEGTLYRSSPFNL